MSTVNAKARVDPNAQEGLTPTPRRNALAISGIKLGLSFHMLDITYGNSAVYISPNNEAAFLDELKSINPNITIETEGT